PTTKELATHMGVDEATVTKHYREISNSVMVSFENLLQNAAENDAYHEEVAKEDTMPEASLAKQELRVQLAKAIDCLTEKERLVVSLYYYEHLKLCEIAQVMQVSEARVCQTRAKAIGKLRDKLQLYLEG
ncbi:MAG: sigma-70 family RNA polymerase sigma factor, partial [Oscillospiraceae bacterium]|nr:sigma-70 family RNA polymerase sigma factor [Oscillospiraceae bacterium]